MSLHRPELIGMRKWRVKDFDNFLIFYLPRHDGGIYLARAARRTGLVEAAWDGNMKV